MVVNEVTENLGEINMNTGEESFNKELIKSFFFILVINQLGAQNLFYNKFISCLYMF